VQHFLPVLYIAIIMMKRQRRRPVCVLVFALFLVDFLVLALEKNNAPVGEPAVRPKTEEEEQNTVRGGREGVAKGANQQQQQRRLGEDKGKTKPKKGDDDDEDDEDDETPPSPTSRPTSMSTVMPTTTSTAAMGTKAPTVMPSTASPTAEPTTVDDDTTVMLSLSIGVAPTRRRRTLQRFLTPDLQNLVADTVTEILHDEGSPLLSLRYDESQSSVKPILFGVDVSWWLHNVTYQMDDDSSTLAQVTREANEVLATAMNSGVLLLILRESAAQIIAVCRPGNELNTPLWEQDEEEPTIDDVPRDFSGGEQDDPTHVHGLSLSWEARQWAGVGILATTMVAVLLLFRRAQKRREKLEHQVVWGAALGTEQDVNSLLNIGWKSDGEEVTAVFDKEKENYNSNGSMLMGGVQDTTVITNPSSASRSHTVLSQSASHHTALSE
jgi:hypothetical protein